MPSSCDDNPVDGAITCHTTNHWFGNISQISYISLEILRSNFAHNYVTYCSYRGLTQDPFRAFHWHLSSSSRDGILDSCPSHFFQNLFQSIINQRTRAVLIHIIFQISLSKSFVYLSTLLWVVCVAWQSMNNV